MDELAWLPALSAAAPALLLVAILSRRGWLLEIAPLTFIIPGAWAKLLYVSALIHPDCGAAGAPCTQVSATIAGLLCVVAPLVLLPPVARFVALLSVDLGLGMLVLGDWVYWQFFGEPLSAWQVSQIGQLGTVLPSVVAALEARQLVLLADVAVGLALIPYYARAWRRSTPVRAWGRACASACCLFLGLLFALPTLYVVLQKRNASHRWTAGLAGYHLNDLVGSSMRQFTRSGVGPLERQQLRHYLATRRGERGDGSRLFGVARNRNVILISAESLNAWVLGLEVLGNPVTPNLSKFADESLTFVNFYDQTYKGSTSDAEFIVLQSLHPLSEGVVAVSDFRGNHFRALPRILSENGYTTLSAAGQPGHFWNMREMHWRLGFQRSYFEESYQAEGRIDQNPWVPDREFFDQTVSILATQAEPFMAFLLTASSHHPYKLQGELRELELGDLEGTLVGDYLHAIHYLDRSFGTFLDRLRDTGQLDRSVIVIYGDHQGFVSERPEIARILGFPPESRIHHWEARKRIPLMIRLPGGEHSGRQSAAGGHLDIAPTLLGVLGIPDEHEVMLGRDLTRGEESLVVFRDGALVHGSHLLIPARIDRPQLSRCYDRTTSAEVSCAIFEPWRRESREELRLSQAILVGDLVPELARRSE